MNGSLPPSSIVLFFSAWPASAATADPARSLPVNATPRIRLSAITLADCSLVMKTLVHVPTGAPASMNNFSNASAHCGTFGACLQMMVLPSMRFGPATRAN